LYDFSSMFQSDLNIEWKCSRAEIWKSIFSKGGKSILRKDKSLSAWINHFLHF
jgi:hypothetical protein